MSDAKVKVGEAILDKTDELLAAFRKRVGAVTGGEPSPAALSEAGKIIAERGMKVTPDQLFIETKSRLPSSEYLAPTRFTMKDPEIPPGSNLPAVRTGYGPPTTQTPITPRSADSTELVLRDPGTIDVTSMPSANPPISGMPKGKKAALIGGGSLLLGGAAGLLGGNPKEADQATPPTDTPTEAPADSDPDVTPTPTIDEDLEAVKSLTNQIPKLKNLKAVQALPEEVTYVGENGQEVTERPEDMLGRAVKAANDELNTLAADYKATEDALERRELTSDIIRAVANIAAGLYGLRNGVDMSGMKFDPIDWVRRQELERAKYADRREASGAKLGARKDLARTLIAQRDMKRDEVVRLIDSANNVIKNDNANAEFAWKSNMDIAKMIQESKQKTAVLEQKATAAGGKAVDAATSRAAKLTGGITSALMRASTAEAKGDDETKAAAMLQVMELNNQYKNVTGKPYIAPAYFTTQGFWGGTKVAEPSDITGAMTNDLTAGDGSGTLTMVKGTKMIRNVDPADEAALKEQGWQRK